MHTAGNAAETVATYMTNISYHPSSLSFAGLIQSFSAPTGPAAAASFLVKIPTPVRNINHLVVSITGGSPNGWFIQVYTGKFYSNGWVGDNHPFRKPPIGTIWEKIHKWKNHLHMSNSNIMSEPSSTEFHAGLSIFGQISSAWWTAHWLLLHDVKT